MGEWHLREANMATTAGANVSGSEDACVSLTEERTQMREDNVAFKNQMLKVTDSMRTDLNAKVNDLLR